MAFLRRSKNQSGIALFMVISAMMVLSLLVTEFTYVVQVNHRMASDGLDSLKAHYLAKSGLKLSMLRLKAYRTLSDMGKSGGANSIQIPKKILDQIWNFPFFYPIPKEIPGITLADKESLIKFEKESTLQGKMVANITSESSKFNLNTILPPVLKPKSTAPNPTPTPGNDGQSSGTGAMATPTPSPPPYDATVSRNSLRDFLSNLIDRRMKEDEDFARDYRGMRLDEMIQQIVTWADPSSPFRNFPTSSSVQPKQGPFYSVSELHYVPAVDDTLFDLFSPNLTTGITSGINVNTMTADVLKALIPNILNDESDAFFKFRDSAEADQNFKAPDDFFKYLKDHVSAFRGSDAPVNELKNSLKTRGIDLIVNESSFKITIQAQVNNASRLLEAWVTFDDSLLKPAPGVGAVGSSDPGAMPPQQLPGNGQAQTQKSGLRITFMRIL